MQTLNIADVTAEGADLYWLLMQNRSCAVSHAAPDAETVLHDEPCSP